MFQVTQGCEHRGDLCRTEDKGELLRPFRVRNIVDHPGLAECDAVEEAQGTHRLHHGGPGHLFFADQIQLIGPNLFRTKPIRGRPKMPRKVGDTAQSPRSRGEVEPHDFCSGGEPASV